MPTQSLFGHLAVRFVQSPENLATEALLYILNRSEHARHAFGRYLSQLPVDLSEELRFRSQQATTEGEVFDLEGIDTQGQRVLIVESKFWAGLTDNQPRAYLQRLSTQAPGLLLFVAPDRRLELLWPELVHRCQAVADAMLPCGMDKRDLRSIHVSGQHALALGSWRSLLSYLLTALEAESQFDVAADVKQLQGLCERMDTDAFLPLRSDDLTSSTGLRVRQFCQLVEDLTDRLVTAGIASTSRLRAAGTKDRYGRYMIIAGFGCMLQCNYVYWSTKRATPLWLSVQAGNWRYSPLAKDRLLSLEVETPTRLLEGDDALLIPLELPTGVDKTAVLDALESQMREIADHLATPKAEQDA